MNYEYIALAGLGLSLLGIGMIGWVWMRVTRIDRVRKEFLIDDETKKVDDVIVAHNQKLNALGGSAMQLREDLNNLTLANKNNFQKIGFVRFNPFGDAGGAISFVLALLDADGNGFVISSLHGRDGNRVYAKEVKKGESKSQLTEEEQEAIKQAV
jgi:hypothetical protein